MNLEDLEAIRMLTNRYSHYLDRNQLESLAALWTEDAVFDETPFGLGLYHGRAAIRGFFEHDQGVMEKQVHYATNFVLNSLDGDHASGSCYFLVYGTTKDGGSVHATGYYDDEYRRVDGTWLFSKRLAVPFLPPKVEAFAKHMK